MLAIALLTFLQILLFIWQYYGSKWIYNLWATVSYDRRPAHYCDKVLYRFSVSIITFINIVIVIYILRHPRTRYSLRTQ